MIISIIITQRRLIMANNDNKQKLEELKILRCRYKKENNANALLRTQALIALYSGKDIKLVAEIFSVSEKTIRNWRKKFEKSFSLKDKQRAGRPPKLTKEQLEWIKKLITENNQQVWVARKIFILIESLFGVYFSVKYLPELLRQLGLSFHKAVHLLYRRNEEKRRKWIQETLPKLYEDKIKEGWRIFYQDEAGFQVQGTLASTWGPVGEKVEIKNYGRRGRMNVIGALELGTGEFHGVLTRFRVNAQRFRRFICHMKREMRESKIMLICDNAPFHKAKWLREWAEDNAGWLRLEFLPGYSPDFNPIEKLWKYLKKEYVHNKSWGTKVDLKNHLEVMLQEIPVKVEAIKGVMKKEIEKLKEAFKFYKTPVPEELMI